MVRMQQKQRQTRKGSKRMTDDKRQTKITEFADAREKMTDEERQSKISGIHKELGILPRKPSNVDEGPYEADTNEDIDTTKQAKEAATVLVAIGATRNVAKFVVADVLDEINEIQQLT